MTCTHCAAELPVNARYCGTCGTPIAGAITPALVTSPIDRLNGRSANIPYSSGSGNNTGPISHNNRTPATGMIAFVIVLLLAGAGAWFGSHPQQQDTTVTTQDNPKIAPLKDHAVSTDGSTPCYTVTIPSEAKATTTYDCEINIIYGPEDINELRVQPLIGRFSNLKGYVDDWKKYLAKSETIISEAGLKVGGFDAHKIIYRYGAEDSSFNRVVIFVYTRNIYTSHNIPQGFEIGGSYSDKPDTFITSSGSKATDTSPTSQQTVDGIIASWKRK